MFHIMKRHTDNMTSNRRQQRNDIIQRHIVIRNMSGFSLRNKLVIVGRCKNFLLVRPDKEFTSIIRHRVEDISENFSILLSCSTEELRELRTQGVRNHEIFLAIPVIFISGGKRMTVCSDVVRFIWM